MATQYGILSISLFDEFGVTVPHDIFVSLDDSVTLAVLLGDAQAYAALVDPITDAASLNARLTIQFVPTAMKALPVEGKAIDTTGLFTWGQAGSPYKQSIDVPAIANAVLDGAKIDLSNADIAAWTEWFAAGHTGMRGVSKFRNVLGPFRGSVVTTRKHRRALSRTSTSVPA